MGVYWPNSNSIRRSLQEELAGVISWWDMPWCIQGDFNVTCFPSDTLGESGGPSRMALLLTL
jgi:hypothetical protein